MLCIYNKSPEPYFNMATEEYLFKNKSEDIFMLWRNNNAIIVGKHQNTLAEINVDYVKEKNIKVVRRLSGGGAVYHDMGNINFTFIVNGENEKQVDFRKYTLPIIEVLQELGVDAKLEGRNDLTIEGKKFSGNAVHIIKNRVLHHGTLLFASEMADISDALKVNPLKFKDKAVKSVRSRVTNISDHLKEPITIDDFTHKIMTHIQSKYPDSLAYELTTEDTMKIEELAINKYSTWDWNFGYQAKYDFEKMINTPGGNIEFHINADKGIIKEIKIYGDFFHTLDISELENALVGTRHEENAVRECLQRYNFEKYIHNVNLDEFVAGMF
jgi:lipoate---protein ligase